MTATPMRQMADSDPAVTVGSELVEDDSPGEETSYEHASIAKTRAPLELTELGRRVCRPCTSSLSGVEPP